MSDYKNAIDIYERAANYCVFEKLLKQQVQDLYFKTILCKLLLTNLEEDDIEQIKTKFEYYTEEDPRFLESFSGAFLSNILGSIELEDLETFDEQVVKNTKLILKDEIRLTLVQRLRILLVKKTNTVEKIFDDVKEDVEKKDDYDGKEDSKKEQPLEKIEDELNFE